LSLSCCSLFSQVEGLNAEIEELSAAFAEAREASQKTQTPKFQVKSLILVPGEVRTLSM
jgi:hypothetical protein